MNISRVPVEKDSEAEKRKKEEAERERRKREEELRMLKRKFERCLFLSVNRVISVGPSLQNPSERSRY
jgi:hypothetical protein